MSNPEQLTSNPERGIEAAGDAARERSAELQKSRETGEQSPEQHKEQLESARIEAIKNSISYEKPAHEQTANASATHHVRPVNSRSARKKAYKDILRHTQAELPPASRTFSKVIHQPVVEKTSAAVGSTIARPNAILFGALFALLLSGSVYVVAKYYGYTLSGFEAIGSFIIGWIVGIVIDFFRLAARRR